MRNRERLVQVQVADVGADRRRARQPHLRVHVRAVHVHLPAVLVDDRADLAGCRPRTRHSVDGYVTIRRTATSRCSSALARRSSTHDVAVAVAGHDHDLHPRHRGAGRVGAVRAERESARRRGRPRRGRDGRRGSTISPANSPCAPEFGCSDTAANPVIRHSACSSSREDLPVALRLIDRRERMHPREVRPGDRQHLGGRVQLHRAGAERDHRRVEPDVLPLEAAGCSASSSSRSDAC